MRCWLMFCCFFFFQAEDGIRDRDVTGVQTCALPIFGPGHAAAVAAATEMLRPTLQRPATRIRAVQALTSGDRRSAPGCPWLPSQPGKIGRASCRERV